MLFLLVGGGAASAENAAQHAVAGIRLAHLDHDCRTSAPVTFGQPFRAGDVPAGYRIALRDGDRTLMTQTDVAARNRDGSVRHAIITVDVPCHIDRSDTLVMAATPSRQRGRSISLRDVLHTGFDSRAMFQLAGGSWQLDARDLLARVMQAGGCADVKHLYCRRWLDGPLASEWVIGAPPVNAAGKPHPHLMVFFAVRAYGPLPVETVRVDTVVENDWAYAANPHDLKYAATISVPGQKAFSVQSLSHYQHARWHHVSWWGKYASQPWFAALNRRYLQDTPAVPRYEDITLSNAVLSKVRQTCAPMDHCDVMAYMGSTGAQPQIGPLPQWSSAYVVNPNDYRAYRWMLADSDALGAYSVHFREQATGEALSIARHPCATTLRAGEVSRCPVAPKADDELLPHCGHDCGTPLQAETAHHGAPAYVAYLVTGDWYYEQELSFWADWLLLLQNPAYRGFKQGLVYAQQVRAQAWGLRTLGDAAYLLPDTSPFKKYFNQVVSNNIAWYNKRYADNPAANHLGLDTSGNAIVYPRSGPNQQTSIPPWQQSFFTWAAGNLDDLGFRGARKMRNYFAKFQLGALETAQFCPELATNYTLRVRDTSGSALYKNFGEVYRKTFPGFEGLRCGSRGLNRALRKKRAKDGYKFPPGTMVGYPDSDTGFVANFQIGLASAVVSGGTKARSAWAWFMSRPVRPTYRYAPQFAVIPTRLP